MKKVLTVLALFVVGSFGYAHADEIDGKVAFSSSSVSKQTQDGIITTKVLDLRHAGQGVYVKDTNAKLCYFVTRGGYGASGPVVVSCENLKYYFGDK